MCVAFTCLQIVLVLLLLRIVSYIRLKEDVLRFKGGQFFLVILMRGWVNLPILMMSFGWLGRRLVMPV